MKRVSSSVSRLVAVFISPLAALLMMFRHSLWYSAPSSMAWMSVVESKKYVGSVVARALFKAGDQLISQRTALISPRRPSFLALLRIILS